MSTKQKEINSEKEEEDSLSILNKKRKRNTSGYESDLESEEENSQNNKKMKTETNNCLTFPIKNNIISNNVFPPKIDSFLMNKNILPISSKKNYNYSCQEITTGKNNIIQTQIQIQINDAKILILENQILLFLLSSNTFYIYEIKENTKYEFIKEIPLDKKNKFDFLNSPTSFFLVTPEQRPSSKNKTQKNVKTKMILYLSIVSCTEKYLCQFDLINLNFIKVRNIMPKKKVWKLLKNDMKFKLYNKNRIICYSNTCAYRQHLYGAKKIVNLKQKNIESISLLNQNLICICTSQTVYVLETDCETILGEFENKSTNKKAKLLKPDNNLLMVFSTDDIVLYDLDSLHFFQKLELSDIINNGETIKKVKQLNNNNIAILFSSIFVVYDLAKNAITFKFDYWKNNDLDMNSMLMEINPNVVLVNNDEKNIYLINGIKGDEIASLNDNDNNFSLCEKIKKYQFKYGETIYNNIEVDNNNNTNYILLKNDQKTFILSSILQ